MKKILIILACLSAIAYSCMADDVKTIERIVVSVPSSVRVFKSDSTFYKIKSNNTQLDNAVETVNKNGTVIFKLKDGYVLSDSDKIDINVFTTKDAELVPGTFVTAKETKKHKEHR